MAGNCSNVWLLTLALLGFARAEYEELPFPSCTESNEYLDISALACTACPTSQTPDAAGTNCQCQSGTVLSGGETTAGSCQACANGTAATRDGLACLACTDPSTVSSGSTCSCSGSGDVLVERDENGALLAAYECRTCPDGQRPSGGVCIDCPAEHMVATAAYTDCQCETGYTLLSHLGGFWGREKTCMPTAERTTLFSRNLYPSTATQKTFGYLSSSQGSTLTIGTSKVVEQLLLPSATECLRALNRDSTPTTPRAQSLLEGNEACQAVGNICVLYTYLSTSAACSLYEYLMSTSSGTSQLGNQEWKLHMPGLEYERGVIALTRSAPPIPLSLALPTDTGSRLRLILGTYSLNGTYLGLRELTDQLQLCPGGAADPSAFLDVGTDMEVSCNIPTVRLLSERTDVVFYDLYLYYDESGAQSSTPVEDITQGSLYPIPVKVLNLQIGGQNVNTNGRLEDQLTRRFYTLDAVSGVASYPELPAAVRYLKSARITLTVMSTDDNPSQMLPPVLEIEYADVAIPSSALTPLEAERELEASGVNAPSSFRMVYTMEFENSDDTINNLFIVSCVFWGLLAYYECRVLILRNSSESFDAYHRLLCLLSGSFATVFFFFLYVVTTWWMCLYKGQRTIYFFMPVTGEDGYYFLGLMPFQVFISCLFGAKCLHMVDIFLAQTSHDVFFIDWEQPRGGGGAKEDEEGRGRDEAADAGAMPISVWRTIFVANEWAKLQDARMVSTEISLFTLLFIQEGLGVGRCARLVPHGYGDESVPEHMLLRFALSSGLLLAASLVQYCAMQVWLRCGKDRVWQFVDLLAVTNISCILLEERHFGFYLHGRSVHDHADADMAQLNAHLKREADGLVTTRGFTPDSSVQTYEIYLSRQMRIKYDAAFLGALYSEPRRNPNRRQPQRTQAGAVANARAKGFNAQPEEGIARQRELNRYLMSYLSTPTPTAGGSLSGSSSGQVEKPIVRMKRGSEVYGYPPEMGYGERSIFLEDAAGCFKRLLLAGREFDVVLFTILTYALFDMSTGNTYVAIFFAYALDYIYGAARSAKAVENIGKKTLLDDRFLL